jgi:hypothetical protein
VLWGNIPARSACFGASVLAVLENDRGCEMFEADAMWCITVREGLLRKRSACLLIAVLLLNPLHSKPIGAFQLYPALPQHQRYALHRAR